MNERLLSIPFKLIVPDNTGGPGNTVYYNNVPFDCTVVYVAAGADNNDTGLTLDINDDASGSITGIDCSDADDPGEWISTHLGGDETPVHIDADSEISFDANNAENAQTITGYMLVLTSDVYA